MRKIYTYYDGSSLPVHDFMNNTDVKIKKKFLFCLDFIKDEHNAFTEPYVKHFSLEKYKRFYELRIKAVSTMVRVIFYEYDGEIILLHAFYKRDKIDTERALETANKILHTILTDGDEINKEYREELVFSD